MFELRKKAVQMFSQEEIFRAIALGALKARAGRLGPGEIINIAEFEMIVAEDENGEGISRLDLVVLCVNPGPTRCLRGM